MSVDELKNAIAQLSAADIARIAQWFDEFRADQWDRQFEQDVIAGHLDAAGQQANADFDASRCIPL